MNHADLREALSAEPTRPLRRVEYEQLVAYGVFEDERVELLEGVIVEMSPQDPRHSAVLQRLSRAFAQLSAACDVRTQMPLAISERSLPEPDLAVVPAGEYESAHPTTALLVAEVASSSVQKDRRIKGELYARAGIPEYWLINLQNDVVEVHTQPSASGYTSIAPARSGDSLNPHAFSDLVISVSALLRLG